MMRNFPLAAILALPLLAAQPTPLERQRLMAHLEMTESWLQDEVANLSSEQLHFRPAPKAWSMLDCVEHLVLSENEYWVMLQKTMAERPSRKESPSEDVDRLWYGIDRTQKAVTTESETPKARYQEIGPALADFLALRAKIRNYVSTTQDDWRHHLVVGWDRDAYQWLVMISAHSQRHILQIREIRHSAGFPKN